MDTCRKQGIAEQMFDRWKRRIGKRRACQLVGLNRSSFYYKSRKKDASALTMRIQNRASTRVRYGYRRIHTLLLREGWSFMLA